MAKEQATASKKSTEGRTRPSEQQATPPPQTKSNAGIKALLIILAVLLLEVVTIGLTIFLTGGPRAVEGQITKPDLKAEEERPIELLVVKDQFPNQRTGRVYLYDTEIYITVRSKNADRVRAQLEAMKATLSTDIAVIFRRAEPSYLMEPTLATLTRQIKAALDERLGRDADGQLVIQEVLIRKCIQFRTEN